MVELYGLLSFLYPDIFTTPGPFEAAFNLSKGQVRTFISQGLVYQLYSTLIVTGNRQYIGL